MARKLGLLVLLASVALGAAMPAAAQKSGNPNPGVIPFSSQYTNLSVQWWQWATGLPVHDASGALFHPLFTDVASDPLGLTAANGQPATGNVFFLGGALFGIDPVTGAPIGVAGPVVRNVVVPPGKRIFFPLVNAETDNAWVPPGSATDAELQAFIAWYIDQVDPSSLFATLDGTPLANLAANRTPSPKFVYTLPTFDDIYNYAYFPYPSPATIGLYSWEAFGDGYYVLLAPLTPGQHELHFGGALQDVTYHITVLPPGKK